jgi:Mg2+-importing ATPase
MFTVAISSIFMKFIPLLPSQILLNNFFSDIPNLTISSDNVDEELLRKPKKWNIKLISRFMFYFGLISSVFDLALILPLLLIMKTDAGVFRTAWFIESALSEIIVVFAIRTKMSFLKSKPSRWLVISSMAAAALTVAITYTAFGERLFEFVKMPILILLFIGIILAAYFITAELAKRYFFRKFEV